MELIRERTANDVERFSLGDRLRSCVAANICSRVDGFGPSEAP